MNDILPRDLQNWQTDGFLKLPGFLASTQTQQLRDWIDEVGNWPADDDKWMHHFEQTDSGARLARTEYVVDFHVGLRQLLTEGQILEVGGALLGQPIRLYKEKINYKYPGGAGYAAHQDAPAYEFVKQHITCAIAIDAATPENGCLFFAPGQHERGLLHLAENGCIEPDFAATLNWQPVPLEPGDAVFFSSYAPHKSLANSSTQSRRTLYLTYNAAAEGNLREAYYADKRAALVAAKSSGEAYVRISKIGHFEGKPVTHS